MLKSKGRANSEANNSKPLLKALYEANYTAIVICKELSISKPNFNAYFSRPTNFKLSQLQHIGYMLNKPLYEVINLATNYKPTCLNYWHEDKPTYGLTK